MHEVQNIVVKKKLKTVTKIALALGNWPAV
jgi:hypothetical protein